MRIFGTRHKTAPQAHGGVLKSPNRVGKARQKGTHHARRVQFFVGGVSQMIIIFISKISGRKKGGGLSPPIVMVFKIFKHLPRRRALWLFPKACRFFWQARFFPLLRGLR